MPIIVTNWPLKDVDATDPILFRDEPELTEAIVEYFQKEIKDEEVFKHDRNVIVSERRIYGAYYDNQLQPILDIYSLLNK